MYIDSAEMRIQRIVDEIRLKNPTSPPATNLGENDTGPPGIARTLEQCRDIGRRVDADAARLQGHAAKLATVCASSAEVVRSVPIQIDREVATLNETLRAFERGNGRAPTTRGDVVNAISTCLDNIENFVKTAHERQKGLAEQVARLEREAAGTRDANSDRRPPASTVDSPERRPAAGGEPSTGDGEGDRPPGIQRHLKSDRLGGNESERGGNESEQEGRESTDPQGLRAQLADLAKRLEGRDGESDRDEQPTQHGSAPQQSRSSWLKELLPVFAVTGTMAAAGLAGPLASVAAAQSRTREPEREPERDLASADAPPDGKSPPGTPPPGAPPNGTVSVQPVLQAEVKTGDFAMYGEQSRPVVRAGDGPLQIVSTDGKLVPWSNNPPDGTNGPFKGFFRAVNQVASAPPPPAPIPAA